MLLIKLNKSNQPLYKQVLSQLIDLIENNVLNAGDKLPSTRVLAKQLGVNRTTIYKAYEELWALGYIESKQGSYSYIRKRSEFAIEKGEYKTGIINWMDYCNPLIKNYLYKYIEKDKVQNHKNLIDFRPLSPDPNLMPIEEYRKCINKVINEQGASLFRYGDIQGYKPLRDYIAKHLQHHAISVTSENILITNGVQNALELLFNFLIKPGSKIVIENPTYSSVIPLLHLFQSEVIGIPVKKEGLCLDALRKSIRLNCPDILYTMPNFQNPTGITTNQAHREQLLKICEQNNIIIIEDGFVEEMKYFDKAILPVKSMDMNGIVIYLGTFSKVLFPGLRIGWIAANKALIQHLSLIKKATDISGNILNQAAMARFCNLGYYDIHLKRKHRIYKKRMLTAVKALKEHIPVDVAKYTNPLGGYTFWLSLLKRGISENEIISMLLKNKVVVSPGSRYFYVKNEDVNFRVSIAHTNEEEIRNGIKIIGNVLKQLK